MTVDEFEDLYAATVRRLVGQVYLLTGDLHEAEEVVQEAFVSGWVRRRSLEVRHAPEAWVRTVAFRLAVTRFRRRRRGSDAWRRHASGQPAHVSAPGPETMALADALQRLPRRQREVLVLYYVCDLSVDQVAAEAGIAAGTVKSHLFRGRSALARLWDDSHEEGSRDI
ncbi:SigE family RNA polymerase sigma factor [Streptomyces griseofuscus]|uniref:SigE family RNA polymerase sigma factor n=1 Tax=Streptomyces griseofuscus TaxID=146922 RepID=UPI003695E15B